MGGLAFFPTILLILVVSLPVAAAAAEAPDRPDELYQSIPERNPFGLRQATQPQKPQEQPAELPRVKLTGITTILGNKRAVLEVRSPAAKPGQPGVQGQPAGQPPTGESLILSEGQREGNIEMLQINEEAGTVRIVNSGQPVTITFEEEPIQAAPPAPAQGIAPPGVMAGTPAATNRGSTAMAALSPPALPSATTRGLPPGVNYGGVAATNTLSVPLPEGLQTNAPFPGAAQVHQLTPEEQTMILQLQEQLSSGAEVNNQVNPPTPTGVPNPYPYQYQYQQQPAVRYQQQAGPDTPPLPPGYRPPLLPQ
jgi:hypothetical protein